MANDVMYPGRTTLGVLGGGQLGRMLILAGSRLGYPFHVFTPEGGSPAGVLAGREFNAPFRDEAALLEFASSVDRVTLEFENIPVAALEVLNTKTLVCPGAEVLSICQNRYREKEFLKREGFPCAPFMVVDSPESLKRAVGEIGVPCVLKSADFGYDGKGQVKIEETERDWGLLWEALKPETGVAVVEQWVDFEKECSVICARNDRGEIAVFPIAENIHRDHILHTSIVPARLSPEIETQGIMLGRSITERMGVVGLLAVELFLTRQGELWVNEMAPRPHNSGHFSFDACLTSQFEQHIRAVCGLPLGSTDLLQPVVMVNLLGDLWKRDKAPDWDILLRDPAVKLHLYGKREAKPGRKMGHFCVLDPVLETALVKAEKLFEQLVDL